MKEYSIKELSKMSGLSEVYLRRSISNGKLVTKKVKLNKNQFKHIISEESFTEFRKNVSHKSKREDGRNKYTSYLNTQEYESLVKLLKDNGLEEVSKLIQRTNQSK